MTTNKRGPKALTEEHKKALAEGRKEGAVVRRYLEALEKSKRGRGRPRTPDTIKNQIVKIDASIVDANPADRVVLIAKREKLMSDLKAIQSSTDLSSLEAEFAKVALAYSQRRGITYSAWRSVGVSPETLRKAKIDLTRDRKSA